MTRLSLNESEADHANLLRIYAKMLREELFRGAITYRKASSVMDAAAKRIEKLEQALAEKYDKIA